MKKTSAKTVLGRNWTTAGLLAAIVCLFYGSRWFFGRLVVPNDFYIHYTWVTFFTNRLAAGCLTPVWLPEVFHGLGAAIFLYYPPLYYYAAGILDLFLDNMWFAMRIVEGLAVGLMAWMAVKHVRENPATGSLDCILAVCVVACSPMLLARLYMLGGIPAFVSCAFLTGALVRAAVLVRGEKRGWDWLLTFWIGVLAWTHNLMVLMAMAAIFGGLCFLAVFRRQVPYGTVAGSAMLGFLLGLPRFVAASLEMPSINHQNLVQLEELLWQNHFILPFGLKTSWALFQWGIGGLLAFGVCLWAGVLLLKRRMPSGAHLFWLGGALTCLFFALPASWFLWKWLPPLQYFQAPTRFLEPLSLCVAFGLFSAIRDVGTSRSGWFFRIPLVLSVALSLALIGRVWQLGIPLEPQLPSWIHDTSNQFEYLPVGQPLGWKDLPGIQPPQTVHLPDGDVKVLTPGRDGGLSAELRQNGDGLRLLPVFHHARWSVHVDGAPVPFWKDGETGLIQIKLAAGLHRIETQWSQGFWSLLSWGTLPFLLLGIPIAGLLRGKRLQTQTRGNPG